MGPNMDEDYQKKLGAILYLGRCEYTEVRCTLASFDLLKASTYGQLLQSSGCLFEMEQKDVKALHCADSSAAAVFLLQCTVRSCEGRLKSAAVHLHLQDCEVCQLLAVAQPPPGAEFAAARELNGMISFEETSSERGMYVRHPTVGRILVGKVGHTGASIKLLPDEGAQELSRLSAVLFVCIAPLTLSVNMSVTVKATLSASGLLKAWRKGDNETFSSGNKEVQLRV